jgi:hypothetical protein
VHIIQLLLAIDKYLIQVRRQRHAKNETIKANYNAAKEKAFRNETATTANRGTRLETAVSQARTDISKLNGKESKASKLMSGKESKAARNKVTTAVTKLTTLNDESGTIKENMTEIGDTVTCNILCLNSIFNFFLYKCPLKMFCILLLILIIIIAAKESLKEDYKDEDLLLNIATKLMDIIVTKISVI